MTGVQNEFDLGEISRPAAKDGLFLTPSQGEKLSRVQIEFNRLMKTLENARKQHDLKQAQLDKTLLISIRELMPLVETVNRLNLDMIVSGHRALSIFKLTPKRRKWFKDLLSGKAADLLQDPVGLAEEEWRQLEAIIEELGPSLMDQEEAKSASEEIDQMRDMMEDLAGSMGVDLDLSDLDPNADPEEFEREIKARIQAAMEGSAHPQAATKKPRKQSKAQLEKERKQREREEAKKRDFKSLFKQLAKALHPDLETDPLMKEHKEVWMKRLTSAYEAGDLRDMLQIEMEWLGEEATNLSQAGDEKLKVYCEVLKEQIAEMRQQTHDLSFDPQYQTLDRFRHSFTGEIDRPAAIKSNLQQEVERHQWMADTLKAGDQESRKMVHDWADAHARASTRPQFRF